MTKFMGKVLPIIVCAMMFLVGTVCAGSKSSGDQAFDNDWNFARFATQEDESRQATGPSAPGYDDAAWRAVTLPHDWSIEGTFDKANPMGGAGGFLPTGIGWYRKSFPAPVDWRGKQISIAFDGVYMNSEVWINGISLGKHPYGYTAFRYDLTPHLKLGERNVIAVRVDNSQQKNSRWYSGSGIYRHVTLSIKAPVHVAPWGVSLTTPEVTSQLATLHARTRVLNTGAAPAVIVIRTSVQGMDGSKVGSTQSDVTVPAGGSGEISQAIPVSAPELWTPDSPVLYKVVTEIVSGARVVDTVTTPLGIRSIAWSTTGGFQINGKTVKFCGGCVHHDNGILGAAAMDRAEERRVELLKRAGYNAVRTSHNPPSVAFLDACDRIGLLVINEAFDCWNQGKHPYDYSKVFRDWWQRDLDSLVLRDMNHPSVIMWSIGNEIVEQRSPEGAKTAKMLADYVRKLDPTRPVTCAMNYADADDLFSAIDIGGYNYLINKHAEDHLRVPDRVMVCSETKSQEVFNIWEVCQDFPYITGDFVWTAMDYLGESGIGRYDYDTQPDPAGGGHGHDSLFPWHGTYCGDLDICGFRKPRSWYRDIIWNGGDRVYVGVREPQPAATKINRSWWGMKPEQSSWTWPGQEGKALQVAVYSACDSVRLYLNGRLLGQRPTTRKEQFMAEFPVPYEPGEIKAVGLRGDKPVTEFILRTAEPAAGIQLKPDREVVKADGQDLIFCDVAVTDSKGVLRPDAAHEISFSVSGPATIIAAGNGNVRSIDPYFDPRHRVHQGRALVVLRTKYGDDGPITLMANAAGLTAGKVSIQSEKTL